MEKNSNGVVGGVAPYSKKGITTRQKCKKNTVKINFTPAPHQTEVINYFSSSPYKGILLFHKLGSGKTYTAIMTAVKMIKEQTVKKIYVFTPGTLRSGWIKEFCSISDVPNDILENVVFITSNYDVSNAVEMMNFDDSIVIVDEVHNIMNGVKNDTKIAMTIYNKLYTSKCRLILLSGTPVINGGESILIKKLIKPEGGSDFSGIISYFPGQEGMYPTVITHEPVKCVMLPGQAVEYEYMYKLEIISIAQGPPPESLKFTNPIEYASKYEFWLMALKFTNSLKFSNFFYGVYDASRIELPDVSESSGGWIKDDTFDDRKLLTEFSPKFTRLILNILKNFNSKHMVYTWFKTKAGVYLLHTILNKCGIKAEMFSGDLTDDERHRMLSKFNSEKNRDGEYIKVLLVTSAGAEGISLLETNNVHILESSTKENKTRQAIGRVVRYKSHYNMPKERQYVNVYRYWSVINFEKCVDEILYERGLKQNDKLEKEINELISNKIEA